MTNFLISCRNDSTPEGKPPTGKPGTKLSNVTTYIQIADGEADYDLRTTMLPADWMKAIYGTTPKDKTVLVFVHGFGDKSWKVVERHTSIKANLPSNVTLISFDWPAGNEIEPYKKDKENALASAPRLLFDCLSTLFNGGFAASNTHLLAHSMGAYVTENAFQLASDIKINHLVMAAADVDQANYAATSPVLKNVLTHCNDLMAYWSTADAALVESQRINPYIPLGLRGFPDASDPPAPRQSLQCTDYYDIYAKPTDTSDEFSHVWYLLYNPPKPQLNDFYTDMMEVLQGAPTTPTRVLKNTLRAKT
jgi:pimeloyl-ACP methyl ester carboxylesterase